MWGFISVVVFVVGLFWGMFALSEASCHSKWELSGFQTSWGPLQGCNIKVDGKWIPEENYREFGQ